MPIIMNNYTPQDIFSNMSFWLANGIHGPKSLAPGEWAQRRDTFLQSNRGLIGSTTGAGLPLQDMAKYAIGMYDEAAISNIDGTISAWEKIKSITEGSGTIYGWDLETFGDVKNAQAVLGGKAGVTELGISRTIFENGTASSVDDYSILVRMTSEQSAYIDEALDVLEHKGWKALDESQQITLNRVSKYRTAKVRTAIIDYMGGGAFDTVYNLADDAGRSVSAVKAGRNFLVNARHGHLLQDVLPKFVSVLKSSTGKDVGLMGANTSGFDVPGLIGLGVSQDNANIINANTADLTMAHRYIAYSHNMSADELNQAVKGARMYTHEGSNTVTSLNESLGYDSFDAHVAGQDARKTVTLGTTQKYLDDKSFIDTLLESHAQSQAPKEITEDSIIYLNNGWLDKNSLDQVRIGSDTTHSYSINSSYWKFDPEKSGYVTWTPEGATSPQESYVLSFKSAEDDTIEFSKAFDSPESAAKWTAYNGTFLSPDAVTQSQIETNARYNLLDFGRREYERFFDSNSAAMAGSNDTNGFASLKQHLDAFDAVQKKLAEDGVEDQARYLYTRKGMESISDILTAHGIKTDTQQRAFVGMYGKLQDESEVLRHIVAFAKDKVADSDHANLTRTVIAHDMHNAALEKLSSIPGATLKEPYETYVMADVFSVDVLGADGNYHAVRGDTVSKLTSGIRYLYEDKNKSAAASINDMRTGVKDLHTRGVIDDATYRSVMSNLSSNPGMYDASKKVAYALNDIFQPFRDHSAVTTYKSVMAGTNTEIDAELQTRIISKHARTPVSLSLQGMRGTSVITDAGKVISLNHHFQNSGLAGVLDTVGTVSASKSLGFATNLTPGSSAYDDIMEYMADYLGYSASQQTLITQMFTGGFKDSYSINKQKDRGLVSALVMPNQKGNSGFIVLTNQQHQNQTYRLLMDIADQDLSAVEMREYLKGHASIFELKAIQKQQVGAMAPEMRKLYSSDVANVTYVSQSPNSIKYSHAGFDFYEIDGVIHGGLKEAGSEVLTTFRKNAANVFNAVLDSDFEKGSAIFRKAIDAEITDESGSASYQGILQKDGGKVRGINFNNSDIMHGYYFEYAEGLNTVAKKALIMESAATNPMVNLLTAFNESLPVPIVAPEELITNPMDSYETIMKSAQWKEFAVRHLNEPIANNQAIQTYLRSHASIQSVLPAVNKFGMTYYDLIMDMISKDTSGVHVSDSVRNALLEYQKVLPHMTQVLSKTNTGYMTSAISPGAFNAVSPGAAINRPVFIQQLYARNIALKQMPTEYLDRIGSRVGSLTVTPQTEQWMALDDIIMPDGTRHADQISSITTTFKQISDTELQANYAYVDKNLKRIASANGLDANLLREAFDATRQAMPTVYEGSLMMSSSLATAYHQATTDTKKLTFDRIQYIEDPAYRSYTKEKLQSLVGQKVDKNTIIGYDHRGAIYWDGLETVLTERNVQEILDDGTTAIVPTNVIDSRKFMISGSEKAIANGVIVTDEFLARTGFQSAEQAHQYLDFAFERVLGGSKKGYIPSVAGNLKVAKHISGAYLDSILNVIVNEYQKAGKMDAFIASMQSNGYSHWGLQNIEDMLLMDTLDSNFVSDISRLLEDIQNNHVGQASVNKKITGILKAFNYSNLAFVNLQSNIQTQIMGNALKLDPRVEAAYRRRDEAQYYMSQDHAKYTIDGKRFEDIIMDELHADTLSGRNDYMRAQELGGGAYADMIETMSKDKNTAMIRHRRKLQSQQNVVTGISEAAQYLANPTDINGRNIVEVTMEDLLKEAPTSSKENLSHFIYRINGEYTDEFIKRANKQGVDLSHGAYTVAINLGREFNVDGKTVSKILVPIYDAYGDYTDVVKAEDAHFAKSMGEFHSLMRTYKEYIDSPSSTAASKIAKAISEYGVSLVEELATDNKKSLGYKTYGKFALPNSTYLLGQDEIAAVTKEMLGLDADEITIQKAIRDGIIDASQAQQLLDAKIGRANILKEIADGGNIELAGNEFFKGYTAAKNGGFLNVIAVNRNTFEQYLDFDIGVFGKSLYDDIVNGTDAHYTEIGQRKFSITHQNIGQYTDEIYEQLTGSLSHDFVRTGNLSKDIDNYIISIKDLNAQIVDKAQRIKADEILRADTVRINQAFDMIGSTYLREIGITTELTIRHPAFAMGTGPANLILDDSVGAGQLRALSPLYSALMNLDHDGDAMGVAIRNATEAMRKDKPSVAAAMAAIEKNALTDIDILKNMIETGEAFKSDRISDIMYNQVQALKAYDPDTYKKTREEIIQSLGINKRAMIDKTAAQLTGEFRSPAQRMQRATTIVDDTIDYIATYSAPMAKVVDAYNKSSGNFLKSEAARIAATKAKINQDNVGMISNASFNLHDAVHVAFAKSDTAKKQKLASLYIHMDFLSEEGMNGLMTLAEQKGIDTKHILDAVNITNTPLFSRGMNSLMMLNKGKAVRTQAKIEDGMVNIMLSLNNLMFKGKSNKELRQIAKDIMTTSMDDYTKLINTTTDADLALELISKRQLRALYELSNEETIRIAYNSPLRRPNDVHSFAEGLSHLEDYIAEHNMASKLAGSFTTTSDDKLGVLANTVYMSNSGVNESRAFVMVPHAPSEGKILRKSGDRYILEFKGIELDQTTTKRWETLEFSGKNTKEIMGKVNKYFMHNTDGTLLSINATAFRESAIERPRFNANIKQAKTRHILDNFYLSDTDDYMVGFSRLGATKRQALLKQIGPEHYGILQKFSATSLDELHEMQKFHNFMKKYKGIQNDYGALIRQINANIVANPEKYGQSTTFTSYSSVVKEYYRGVLGKDTFHEVNKVYKVLGDVDFDAYDKILNLLRDNTYDIISEKQQLEASIESLKAYSDYGIEALDNAINKGPTTVKGIVSRLSKEQNKNIHLTESKVYDLFGSTHKMNTYFGWTKPSHRTIVGFGEYMGYSFDSLSQQDIDKIFQYGTQQKNYYLQKSGLQAYAYTSTMDALEVWNKTHGGSATSARTYKTSKITTQQLEAFEKLSAPGKFRQTMEDAAKDVQKQQQTTAKSMKRNTVRGSLMDGAKEVWDKIPKKTVGIAVGAMAAIGVVNNMLHNQRTKSPLAPSRRENGSSDVPVTSNGHMQQRQTQAPMSQKRTVYHDSESGYHFKVSAKTNNYINDMNNARLIGMSGGGNSSVYTQSDMSGVTDNWLSNKFAELT